MLNIETMAFVMHLAGAAGAATAMLWIVTEMEIRGWRAPLLIVGGTLIWPATIGALALLHVAVQLTIPREWPNGEGQPPTVARVLDFRRGR